jgi:hypothetical protein
MTLGRVALVVLLIALSTAATALAAGPRRGPYYGVDEPSQYGLRGHVRITDEGREFNGQILNTSNRCNDGTSFSAEISKQPNGKYGFRHQDEDWLAKGTFLSRVKFSFVVDGPGGCERARFKVTRVGSGDGPR